MGTEKERLELEQKLARYRELAREYPDGEIALVISGSGLQGSPTPSIASR
jgi:hypothetical protein